MHINISLVVKNLLYVCCRDGFQRDNLTQHKTDKKRLSLKSSRKLTDSYCLARMYVKHYLSVGNVEVEYNYTHTNHSPGINEFKHLPLPASVRKEILEKFSKGITKRDYTRKNHGWYVAITHPYSYMYIP